MCVIAPLPCGFVKAQPPPERRKGCRGNKRQRTGAAINAFLLAVAVLLLVGSLPHWRHSRDWGYGPSGVFAFLLAVVLILAFLGFIPNAF